MKKLKTLINYLIFINLVLISLLIKIFNYKLIIISGSYGDIFCIFSILEKYICIEKKIIVIYPKNHEINLNNFFKKIPNFIFPIKDKQIYLFTESFSAIKKYKIIRNILYCNLIRKQLIFSQISLNESLKQEIIKEEIHYLDALRKILLIDENLVIKKCIYSESQIKILESILKRKRSEFNKIAIISPYCNTHINLTANQWITIGECLKKFGFDVIYNISGLDDKVFIYKINKSNLVYASIPSNLCPLIGSMAGIVMGRLGGGFDILTLFGNPKKTILILLDVEANFIEGKLHDYHSVDSAYLHFKKFGLILSDIIKLNINDSNERLIFIINSSLKKIFTNHLIKKKIFN